MTSHCFTDREGRIWIGRIDYGGCVLEGFACARSIPFLIGHTVKAIHQDRLGAMWFGTDRGLYRDSAGAVQHFTSENGLPHDFVRVIHEARDGSLWFGTNGGGLARYRHGRGRSGSEAAYRLAGPSQDRGSRIGGDPIRCQASGSVRSCYSLC